MKANYGIETYSDEKIEFHKDIMKVLKMKKHRNIPADDCMIVFGRCYAVYCLSELAQNGLVQIPKQPSQKNKTEKEGNNDK